eukprot:TRINITY_DN2066_c0_g1_i2.p1 TRINITY_DN2066_c0_g1~~TRINITY_DN2066_c0_g1_i2.p1  ORF type:complete len:289 (-),score=52.12 TRINITY_DN2066_c0_g1_i2:55-921(-)
MLRRSASSLQQLLILIIPRINPTNTRSHARRSLNCVARAASSHMENPLKQDFEVYRDCLNELNDKRERLVKCSRDVTQNSKKVIFQIHRISSNDKEAVLEQAEKGLLRVTDQYLSPIVKELQDNENDIWKLRRAYSPGIQEYVEAATTLEFCKTGRLLTLEEINSRLISLGDPSYVPFKINVIDYVLGVGDLTGELMRLAISRVAEGEINMANTISSFVRDLYSNLCLIAPILDDSFEMNKKMDTMLQSLVKIENACYNVHVRGSEFIPLPETASSAETSVFSEESHP